MSEQQDKPEPQTITLEAPSPGAMIDALNASIGDTLHQAADEKSGLVQSIAYYRAVAVEATLRANALAKTLVEAQATVEEQSRTIAGLMGQDAARRSPSEDATPPAP